jgi:hypothetical protein
MLVLEKRSLDSIVHARPIGNVQRRTKRVECVRRIDGRQKGTVGAGSQREERLDQRIADQCNEQQVAASSVLPARACQR